MLASVIPDEVFRRSDVGAEFIASAATSPMESQHVDENPRRLSAQALKYKHGLHLTCDTRVAEMTDCKRTISQEKHYSYLRTGSTGIICITQQGAIDLQPDPVFTLLSIDD